MAHRIITISLPPDVAAIVEETAKKERRSFSAQVAVLIERATERAARKKVAATRKEALNG